MDFKKNIVYYYDDMIGTFHYSTGHPMKPFRATMTYELLKVYDVLPKMDVVDIDFAHSVNRAATEEVMTTFHSDEYIDLIKSVTPENKQQYEDQLYRFNFREDCPVMERLWDFCHTSATGSVVVSSLLAEGKHTYGFNWSGGLHHAKQSEASGFCYINDCVLGILELLKVYQRVLYIDIDIHHGDGVEEAFYLTDRVMTCSFHKFKDYFPGTGHIEDVGKDAGQYHAVNFPLDEGVDDEAFIYIFKPVIAKIMENFRPEAVVLQCGGDSLAGDRLGCFNLSIKGHGFAAEYIKSFGIPTMLCGGGGYTLRNVPRAWAYETSIMLGEELANDIPDNEYKVYFAPDCKLHLPVSNMENQNSLAYLDKTIEQIVTNLNGLVNRPGAQISVNSNQVVC